MILHGNDLLIEKMNLRCGKRRFVIPVLFGSMGANGDLCMMLFANAVTWGQGVKCKIASISRVSCLLDIATQVASRKLILISQNGYTYAEIQTQQESIPVGCVPLAC